MIDPNVVLAEAVPERPVREQRLGHGVHGGLALSKVEAVAQHGHVGFDGGSRADDLVEWVCSGELVGHAQCEKSQLRSLVGRRTYRLGLRPVEHGDILVVAADRDVHDFLEQSALVGEQAKHEVMRVPAVFSALRLRMWLRFCRWYVTKMGSGEGLEQAKPPRGASSLNRLCRRGVG